VPIALEVTSLRDSAHLAGVPAALSVQERLSAAAEEEELGSWIASVVAVQSMKALEPRILDLVRQGREIRPGWYTADDLLAYKGDAERQALIKMHHELKAMGLEELTRWPSKGPNVIWVLPMSGVRMVGDSPGSCRTSWMRTRESSPVWNPTTATSPFS
jgi:hypothetical protein